MLWVISQFRPAQCHTGSSALSSRPFTLRLRGWWRDWLLSLCCLHPHTIVGEQTGSCWSTLLLRPESVCIRVCLCTIEPVPAVFKEQRRPPSGSSCSDDAQQAAWVCFQEWEENNWLPVRGWKQMKERLSVIFPDETYTVSYSPCNSSCFCYRRW